MEKTTEITPQLTEAERQEKLRKIEAVLSEAVAEWELLEKMDIRSADDTDDKKDDDESDEDKEKKKKKDDKMNDETLKSEFARLQSEMEARGFLQKSEPESKESTAEAGKEEKVEKTETEVKKTEANAEASTSTPAPAPAQPDKVEDLKKSFESEISELKKTVSSIHDALTKIAAQPAAPRKGVSGYQPLRKNEDQADKQLNKAETVTALLDAQKKGNKQVTPDLINRIETGRLMKPDYERIKGILG